MVDTILDICIPLKLFKPKFLIIFLVVLIITLIISLSRRQYEITGWEKHKSRNILSYISDNPDTFHILPKSFCATPKFLVIFIISSPGNFKSRQAIRNTWARKNELIQPYFLLGTTTNNKLQEKLIKESETYNDLIQENFLDSYNNLTLKSVTILKLTEYYCGDYAKYIMKVDDDIYVNMELFLNYLEENVNQTDFLSGRVIQNSRPIRDPNNKWYCPYYICNYDVFPTYLSGCAYVMSPNVARALYQASFITPLVHLEDVYVTGMCAKNLLNISYTNNLRFTTAANEYYEPCQVKEFFTRHYQTPESMYELDKILRSKNDSFCPKFTFSNTTY